MNNKLPKLFLVFSAGLFLYALWQASIPPGDGRPSPLSSLTSALFGGPSLINSNEEILMGYRNFDADIQDGELSFHGAAFTFLDADDPTTFTPYNFAFAEGGFVQMPDTDVVNEFYTRNDADFPTVSGVDPDSCVKTRPDTGATAAGMHLISPVLCQITSPLPDTRAGMIGVIYPADNTTPLEDGDATCRAEIAHWLTLPGFADTPVVLCAIVDRPYKADAYSAVFWMDVIFYQHYAGELYNMRADTRNFQRIR